MIVRLCATTRRAMWPARIVQIAIQRTIDNSLVLERF